MEPSPIASGGENQPREKLLPRTDTDIFQLPPEMLTKIFQKLSVQEKGRVAQVCRAWRDVAYLHLLWRHLVAEVSLDEKFDPFLIPSLVKRGVCKVKVTALSGHHLRDLMDGIPNLTNLNLKECGELDDITLLSAFSKKRFFLTKLNMSKCMNFADTSITLLAMKLKNLNILSLKLCPQLTDMSLLLISNGLLSLKQLILQNNALITDKGIANLSGIITHKADSYCQLDLLSISSLNQLTDQSLKHLNKGQTNLQKLYLQNCNHIAGRCFEYISEMVANLKTLGLNGRNFGDDQLIVLFRGKSSFNYLYLWNNTNLTDDGLATVGKMVHLRILNINLCSRITHVGLKNLAEQGSRISTLYIINCHSITNDGLAHIAKLPCLTKLELQSAKIDNNGLVNLAEGKSKITNLNLTGCKAIQPQALRIIASGLFSMQILTLDENHVNDAGMDLVARTLADLASLVSGKTELIGEIVKIRKTLRKFLYIS